MRGLRLIPRRVLQDIAIFANAKYGLTSPTDRDSVYAPLMAAQRDWSSQFDRFRRLRIDLWLRIDLDDFLGAFDDARFDVNCLGIDLRCGSSIPRRIVPFLTYH